MQRALLLIDTHRECVEWLIEESITLERVSDALSAILAGRVLKVVVDFEKPA
jgi:hypothetical protein